MDASRVVMGVFSYLDDAVKAIKYAKGGKYQYRVYSPVPHHEIEELTMPEKSPVRKVTFVGGLLGVTGGFTLAILCSMDYPLRVSAKAVVSPPGFVVIGYECFILFSALFTFGALLHFCRIPDIFRKVGFDPRFTDDKFGVVIGCDPSQVEEVARQLKSAGAEDVDVRDAL